MINIKLVNYDDLPDEEKFHQPNNGRGKESANYILITENNETLAILSDAVEPEDATFSRDFKDVIDILEMMYLKGLEAGKKINQ